MRIRSIISVIMLLLSAFHTLEASGQSITPVDNDDQKPRQPTLHYYDKHGNPLDEPVLFLADLDTVKTARPGPVYPLLQSASIGVNFFDGVMQLCGQKHASYDIWASLSLHNWFEPVMELGIGYADTHPEDGNFRYKCNPSFYGKLGINYNFLYKSNPDYQMFFGLRGGYSKFSYDITDITINSGYWNENNNFSIMSQNAHALYGEVLAGIKVKLWKRLSMGWNLRYHFKFKCTDGTNSTPWFIPGYGTNGKLSVAFSLIYTIPLSHDKKEE